MSSLTGLHEVAVPVDGPHATRIVITSRTGRPVLIDPRAWDVPELGESWRHLPLPLQNSGFVEWPELKRRFHGISRPWHRVHYGLFILLATLGCIAYIALVVNLPFLL